jgi:hypothetical protein
MPRMEVQHFFKVKCIYSGSRFYGAVFFNGWSHSYRYGW